MKLFLLTLKTFWFRSVLLISFCFFISPWTHVIFSYAVFCNSYSARICLPCLINISSHDDDDIFGWWWYLLISMGVLERDRWISLSSSLVTGVLEPCREWSLVTGVLEPRDRWTSLSSSMITGVLERCEWTSS